MAKTQKQIADTLGVSKQKVYRYIKKHQIKEAYQENGRLYYDETAEKAIKHGLTQKITPSELSQNKSLETVVNVLTTELETKNQQINALNDRIADLTKALIVAQEIIQVIQTSSTNTTKETSVQKRKIIYFLT